MSGRFLIVFAWCALAFFLTATVWRILAIARLPVHLRWDLAPIPRERGKRGGTYLEEYEWWKKARKTSAVAPLVYIVKEIFLLRSVWRHNRALWPFSFAMHLGIYLLFGAVLVLTLLAVRVYELQTGTVQIGLNVASTMALCSYLLGTAGTVGLLLKRVFDPNLRWSNDTGTFLNLLFLAAVFVSGGYAWFVSHNAAGGAATLIGRDIALLGGFRISFPLGLHVTLFLLFCIYLPLTNMVHFAAKYFSFHAVLWNDKPLNERMEREMADLLSHPVGWNASHTRADGRESWAEVAKEEGGNDRTRS
jgi:nitrate reductase gamma subunit